MAKKSFLSSLTLLAIVVLVTACASLQSKSALPATHPTTAELDGVPPKNCMECHERGQEIPYQSYVHTADFGTSHRPAATQDEAICAMCHQTSFCNDCHATRVELKPSIKNQTETYRSMPHRGDYLSRHRIDGRVDPTPCFRCHGNPKSARTCANCHG
jgi:hypothetical protein